jgi:hypothetical protein
VVSLGAQSKSIIQKAKHQTMDKVMKRLGIKLALESQYVILVVHCNAMGSPCGGGHSNWLIALRGYALKFNPTIDDIPKQPLEEINAIKDALDWQFEYLNHPLNYKSVKKQVAIMLKIRRRFLKKKIERAIPSLEIVQKHIGTNCNKFSTRRKLLRKQKE